MIPKLTVTDRTTPKARRDAEVFLASLTSEELALVAELLDDGQRPLVKDLAEERGFTRGAGGAVRLAESPCRKALSTRPSFECYLPLSPPASSDRRKALSMSSSDKTGALMITIESPGARGIAGTRYTWELIGSQVEVSVTHLGWFGHDGEVYFTSPEDANQTIRAILVGGGRVIRWWPMTARRDGAQGLAPAEREEGK